MIRKCLSRSTSLAILAALLAVSGAADARKKKEPEKPDVIAAQVASFPQGVAVHSFYKRYAGPQWFKDGGEAAVQLARVLRRAQLDGLAQGPALADQVERTAQSVAGKGQPEVAVAEQVLSAVWVTYVEAIQRPTNDVIYGYPTLVPQPSSPDRILSVAAAAPALAQHLEQVSAINPLYARLRQSAWAQMGAAPGASPDPRIVKNLERLRSLPKTDRFALVNIAGQTLTMYENGQPVDSMKVIVGTRELPTPMISSVIYYATFNPYWNVPEHLVRKTVAPNVIKSGLAYLSTRGYQVMTSWSADAATVPASTIDWAAVASGRAMVRVRQMPNAGNSMGKIKYSFQNGEGIFLHDTPSKDLFAKAERTLSNGCVRLQDAARFGRWLLKREPVAPSSSPEQFVPLPAGVPVYITYLTAQESNGQIAYLNDIYGWDAGARFKPLGSSASAAR